jgi:hypothetical protein
VVLAASFALTYYCRSGLKQGMLFLTFRITGVTTLVKYQHIYMVFFLGEMWKITQMWEYIHLWVRSWYRSIYEKHLSFLGFSGAEFQK